MARLYANENFPLPVVKQLRALGHDVLTVRETGKADRQFADAEVLALACREKRTVITLNRKHFIKLHSQQPDHCGIIVCTYDPHFEIQANRIHQSIADVPLDGTLIRVNRPNESQP